MHILQAEHHEFNGEKMSGYRESKRLHEERGVFEINSEQQVGYLNSWKLIGKALWMEDQHELKQGSWGGRGRLEEVLLW